MKNNNLLDYELDIDYIKICSLNSNGEKNGKEDYSIEIYDINDCISSTIRGFESFEDMKIVLNEENLFYQLDNDEILVKIDEEGVPVKFNRVKFNGKIIERKLK
ncbi:hypothetical protein [Paraclostridium bifermentans]|uniref:hypothetical protein n=1 Tax=Paraclostridium bifermentans TaxID=1490 RepID=UPI00115795B8|nr:hypothetical protein [Paraclostridium bifermentans]TQO55589.1 hypothetical protein D5S05_17400 [Paraclostridium bifermentans]